MKRFLKRSAFTIVEMVIVIAVIGILATVMVPTISGMIERANKSADTQFAASLTIQLAMESVDGGINSEEDLRRIVNQYYGEWEGDTLVKNYYDEELVPKAAKSGNHFWYDVETGAVVAATYEKLLSDNPKDPTQLSIGTITMDASGGAVAANITQNNFEAANPRTITLDSETHNGKTFFLMDCGGAEIVGDVFNLLDGCPDHVEMGTVFEALNAPDYTDADNELAATVLEKLLKTGVLTNAGLIAGSTNLEYIYVPGGTTRLGSSTYLYNGTEVSSSSRSSITIPENYVVDLPAGSMFGEDSLKGFPDRTLLNIPTDDASKLGDFFEPNSAYISGSTADNNVKSFVIVLGSSVRYGQDEAGGFYLLNADGTMGDAVSGVTSGYKQELKSFTVGLNSTANKKLYIKTEGNILYIANDYTGDLILSANDFKDTEGNTMTPGRVTWQYTDASGSVQSVTGEKLTVAANNVADGTSVMVQVQGKFHEMTAKLVKIERTWVDTVGGKSPTDYDANEKPIYTLSYDATQGGSWNFAPGFSTTDGIGNGADEAGHIVMDAEPYFSSSSEKLSNNENKIVIGKFETNVACNINDTVTFGYGSARETVTINLVDTSKATFAVNSSIQTQLNYGLGSYAIGTAGHAITWGDLFQRTAHVSGQNVIFAYDYNGTTFKTEVYGADWEDQQVDFTGVSGTPAITVKIAVAGTVNENGEVIVGAWCPLDIRVIAGAYNVSTPDEWKSVPNSTNIVLLKDITFPDVEISAMNNGNGYYSKNIGGAKIYGNLNRINFSKFLIKVKGNNYFLRMGNGSQLNDLIINGPSYNTRQDTQSNNGYYVSGIETTSTSTINNCYISGFRTGIYAQGTTNINDTVINGGALANINIHGSITINFNNVETYQYAQSNVKIGAGIFIDNNDSTSTNVTMTAFNLRQYNFYTEAQIKEIANSLATGAGSSISFSNFSSLLKDGYYHAGILTWSEKNGKTSDINTGNGINGYVSGSYTFNFIVYRSAKIYGRGENCPVAPVTSYSIDSNFLASRLK